MSYFERLLELTILDIERDREALEVLQTTCLENPSTTVDILSGIGSLVLVVLTAWYAWETRRIVTTERELRRKDALEEWYGSMLSLIRQLTFEWEYQLAMRGDRSGIQFDENDYAFQNLENLIESLETEAYRSPNGVNQELVDILEEFSREWRQLRSSNRVYIPHDSEAENSLLDAKSQMEASSNRFGRE